MDGLFKLNDLFRLSNTEMKEYKIHLAAFDGYEQPLDVFVRNRDEWKKWNEWRGGRDDFNRTFILGLICDYHRNGKFVFGGIFKVIERYNDWQKTTVGYKIELTQQFDSLIGRMVVDFYRYQGLRGRSYLLENFIDFMTISEILPHPYQGEDFPGYENVIIEFSSLELLVKNQKLDWKVALENVKGVYLIVDKSTEKMYVGSAYGHNGIWDRWLTYINTGHGYNNELISIINSLGVDYARKNFKFSILEIFSMKTDDNIILNRETYWKRVLLTRGRFGLNKN